MYLLWAVPRHATCTGEVGSSLTLDEVSVGRSTEVSDGLEDSVAGPEEAELASEAVVVGLESSVVVDTTSVVTGVSAELVSLTGDSVTVADGSGLDDSVGSSETAGSDTVSVGVADSLTAEVAGSVDSPGSLDSVAEVAVSSVSVANSDDSAGGNELMADSVAEPVTIADVDSNADSVEDSITSELPDSVAVSVISGELAVSVTDSVNSLALEADVVTVRVSDVMLGELDASVEPKLLGSSVG